MCFDVRCFISRCQAVIEVRPVVFTCILNVFIKLKEELSMRFDWSHDISVNSCVVVDLNGTSSPVWLTGDAAEPEAEPALPTIQWIVQCINASLMSRLLG